MSTIIMTANFVSAIFLLVLILGIYITTKEPSKKSRWYWYTLWVCFLGLLTNGLSFLFEGIIDNVFVLTLTNYLAFISIDFLMIVYAIYLYYFIKDRNQSFTFKFNLYIIVLGGIDYLFNTIGTITKGLFWIENGLVIEGPLWNFTSILPGICLLSIFVLLLLNIKEIGVGNVCAFLSHLLITIALTIVQFINPELEFGYIGVAVAMLIIYIIVQSRAISEARIRAEVLDDLTSKDVLTGLKNRRGFEGAIKDMSECQSLGAVFCDLNALKEVNDTKGHEEGDLLIQKFSNIFMDCFKDGEVCRISGDEFVALISYEDEQAFFNRMKDFRRIMDDNNKMAAFGYSTGEGKEALEIVKEAERKMYIDKDSYYKETGKIRRCVK